MTSPNPIVGSTPPSSTSSSSSSQNAPSNVLGPDSFITLLTAQLQAQDPLSPMDPDQMVDELTSINTLQQIIQIRSDMDTLVSSIQGGQSTSSSTTTGDISTANSANNATNNSVVHTAAKFYSQLNSLNFNSQSN